MNKAAKAEKAAENSRHYLRNVHNFVSGGRVYQTDITPENDHAFRKRGEEKRATLLREKMSATQLYNIEQWLAGNAQSRVPSKKAKPQRVKYATIPKEEIHRIVLEYGLEKENPKNGKSQWVGNPDFVFDVLKTKSAWAATFKKWKGLQYAFLYGDDRSYHICEECDNFTNEGCGCRCSQPAQDSTTTF
jgi:hypothetical protein